MKVKLKIRFATDQLIPKSLLILYILEYLHQGSYPARQVPCVLLALLPVILKRFFFGKRNYQGC